MQNNRRKYINLALTALFLVACISFSFLSYSESARDWAHQNVLSDHKVILSKMTIENPTLDHRYVVLKCKRKNEIFLEFYKIEKNDNDTETETFTQRIILNQSFDSYMKIKEERTNLAFVDLNADGENEILAPAFAQDYIPRLNIIKFDTGSQSFYLLNEVDLIELSKTL